MNDTLRRAIFRAGFSEEDVAARLEVDPKTVRRWMGGRLPYPRHRRAMAQLLTSDETDLWPELRPVSATGSQPDEVRGIYPHRWSIPRDTWLGFFTNAERRIDVLVYSGLFLAEDAEILDAIAARAEAGVAVRFALGDADSPHVVNRGEQEGIDDAMAAKIRNSQALLRRLVGVPNVELRLHRSVLYNSIYRADDHLLVNQHAYGLPAAQSPVLDLRGIDSEMAKPYMTSFDQLWPAATAMD